MPRHALGRPTAPAHALAPASSTRRRGVAALLLGATVAAGAAALVPGVAAAAPVPPPAPTASPAKADLAVTVDGTPTIPANGLGEVEITVTNNGPVTADRVRTTVSLTPGVVILDAAGPYNERTAGGTTVRFDEPDALASGESRTYAVLLGSTRDRASSATLSAGTASSTLDPALRNNRATFRVAAGGGLPF